MPSLPEWAEAPGYGWEHHNNFSDIDVVWYHGEQVIYQTREGYTAPSPTPVTIVQEPEPKPKSIAPRLLIASAAVSAVVGALVPHVKLP